MENIPGTGISPEEETVFRNILPGNPLAGLAREYMACMLRRERSRAADLVLEAAGRGTPIGDLYLHVLQPVQYEIGWLWQTGKISVGHEHYCTNATQLVMSMLYPRLFSGERSGRRVLAACVQGELHELGLRMVADFFEMAGWDTQYLGANTPPEGVAAMMGEWRPNVVAVGVTMRQNLDEARTLVQAVRAAPGAENVKVLVGGRVCLAEEALWRELGADGTATDARQAVELAERLMQGGSCDAPATAAPPQGGPPRGAEAEPDGGDDFHDESSRMHNTLVNLQRELAKKNAELGRLNELKSQFLGMAAHDLRKPAGLVLAYSEFLAEEMPELDGDQARFLGAIHESALFMRDIIDNFLDVAMIEAGRFDVSPAPVDPAGLLRRAVELVEIGARKKGVAVRAEFGAMPRILADESKLEQAFVNILDNAAEHTPPGGEVRVAASIGDGVFSVAVADQGPGIPPEEVEWIFSSFGRGGAPKTGGERSIGLGLAIARKVAEAHGGTLLAGNPPEGGAVFTLSLPVHGGQNEGH